MIFTDTGAWIALTDKSDRYHRDAVQIYKGLKQQHARFLTTDYVIDETVTRIRYDADHATALRCLELMFQAEASGVLQIEYINKAILQSALRLFRKYDDIVFSVTDCTSFVVCKNHHIQWAFAFDHHFSMVGLSLCSIFTKNT